jgi:biopolymer transport protein ExbD
MPLKLNPDELPTINLTSMIDVVFLLLIFFMVGTRFSDSETSMSVDLARVSSTTSQARPAQSKTVNVYRDGAIELDNRKMSLTEVVRLLNGVVRTNSQVDVYIRADGMLPHQKVAEVMDAVKNTGARIVMVNTAGGSTKLSR